MKPSSSHSSRSAIFKTGLHEYEGVSVHVLSREWELLCYSMSTKSITHTELCSYCMRMYDLPLDDHHRAFVTGFQELQ